MSHTIQLITCSGIALLIGVVLTWLFLRLKIEAALEQGRSELSPELAVIKEKFEDRETVIKETQAKSSALENKISVLEQEKGELEKNLAIAQQKDKDQLERFFEISKQLEGRQVEIKNLQRELTERKVYISEINTRIEEERKSIEEKLALLNKSKLELTNQFKALAQEIFEEKGKKFAEQNQNKLETLLTPFREQMNEFKKKVEDVYINEGKDRASLKKEIESLCNLHQKFNKEAINLTLALKGDKKTQGTWGEMILEKVLEQSGLRKGIEYEAQGGFRNSENKLLKPDVVVRLPENKDILVDSKVSLSAYEQYCSTDDSIEKKELLKAHIKSIRDHITFLSNKEYSDLKGLRSLDFVLLFIPIEPAFSLALQNDERLYSDAFEKRIIIVTPTTLLATLRTIKNVWQLEKQNQNTRLIAEMAGTVYNKLRGFVEDMEKLGNQLALTSGSYDDAMKKLTHGRGNLIYQAKRFVELGVKVKKELPRSVTEKSDIGLEDNKASKK